jgi:hypothetical protein
LAPEPVQSAIGQDTLKQHGELSGWLVSIVLGQLHHAVLNNVKRGLVVPNMVESSFERPFFNAFQKVGKFLFCRQEELR